MFIDVRNYHVVVILYWIVVRSSSHHQCPGKKRMKQIKDSKNPFYGCIWVHLEMRAFDHRVAAEQRHSKSYLKKMNEIFLKVNKMEKAGNVDIFCICCCRLYFC